MRRIVTISAVAFILISTSFLQSENKNYPPTRRVVSPQVTETKSWEEFLTTILKQVLPTQAESIEIEPKLVEESFFDLRHYGLSPSRPWLNNLIKHTYFKLYGHSPSQQEIETISMEIYTKLREYEFLDFININQPRVTYRLKGIPHQVVQEIDPEWIELEQALLEDQRKAPTNLEVYKTLEEFYRESIQKYPQRLYYYWQLSWVFSALGEHEMRRAIFLQGAKQEMHALPLYIKKINLAINLKERENAIISWGNYEDTDRTYLRNHALKYYLHFPEIFMPDGHPISPSAPRSFREAMFKYGNRAREIILAKDTEFYAFYRDGIVNFLAYRPETREVVGFRMRKLVEGRWEIAIDTLYKASPGMISDLKDNHLIDLLIDRNGYMVAFDGYKDSYRIHRLPEQINEFTYFGLNNTMYEPAFQEVEEKIIQPLKENSNALGVIMIAGVSAAGKTPGAELIRSQLLKRGINAKILSMDLYFINRDTMPRRNGTYDYDNPQALDIERFNSDLRKLLRGERVELPRYDFESGKSNPHSGVYLELQPGEVLIIEGIHALNPDLTGGIKSRINNRRIFSVRIFVDASPELRLGRRIVRDWETRGYAPVDTIRQWENVRYGEDNYIYPTKEYADVVIDTTVGDFTFITSPLYFKLREALNTALSQAETENDVITISRIEELLKKFYGGIQSPKPGP